MGFLKHIVILIEDGEEAYLGDNILPTNEACLELISDSSSVEVSIKPTHYDDKIASVFINRKELKKALEVLDAAETKEKDPKEVA